MRWEFFGMGPQVSSGSKGSLQWFDAPVVRYGVTGAVVAAMVLLRWALIPVMGSGTIYATVFPAMIVLAVMFGKGPALFGNAVGIVLIECFFAGPIGYSSLTLSLAVRSAIIVVTTYYVAMIGDTLRAARRRAEGEAAAARAATAALAANEAHYRELVQNANSAILRWSRDGTITFFNEYAQEFFGWSEPEVVGRNVSILVPGRESTGNDLSGLVRDIVAYPERYVNFVNENVCRDGRRVWMTWTNKPILDEQGEVTEILAVGSDVTERRRGELELQRLKDELELRVEERTAELTAANRELESFGYTVSHDLRAPLRHIASFIEMLDEHAGAGLDEESRHYLQTISQAATRMGKLIDDLLTLSRLGRAAMSEGDVDLRSLVDDALRELTPETDRRTIVWQIEPLATVRGDRSLLHTVMVNLLSNALKYSRDRDPARIEIGSRKEDGQVLCYVRDNGVGFDMRFAGKLFGVFQRLHAAARFEGTGIGLASVRRIVERHGGRAWAEGAVDQGATFFFSLPCGKGTLSRAAESDQGALTTE